MKTKGEEKNGNERFLIKITCIFIYAKNVHEECAVVMKTSSRL